MHAGGARSGLVSLRAIATPIWRWIRHTFIHVARMQNASSPTPSAGRHRIYIMTLGVLAAYRNHGIGSKLVQSVLDHFESQKNDALHTVDEIMLHVQTSNNDAMKFYGEKFGFEKGELVENYYNKRIDPPHCFILTKKLR